MKRYQVMLDRETVSKLKRAGGNLSAGIRLAAKVLSDER